MKNCTNCELAIWDRTAAGKLHPSGDGRCGYDFKIPQLPASMTWLGNPPKPFGGQISRRMELRDHCVYFRRKSDS